MISNNQIAKWTQTVLDLEMLTHLERTTPTEGHCHLPGREFHFDVSARLGRGKHWRKKQKLEGGGDCNAIGKIRSGFGRQGRWLGRELGEGEVGLEVDGRALKDSYQSQILN